MDTGYPLHEQALDSWLLFVLVVLRVGGLTIFAPFFGGEVFYGRARLMLAAALSIIMWPAATATAVLPENANELALVVLASREICLGLAIGFLSSFVFLGAQLAGEMAGQAIGLSMANVVDPTTDSEVPLIGYVQMNLAMLVFIVGKLHLLVLYIVYLSYDLVPIGVLAPDNLPEPLARAGILQATDLFHVALQLGLPVIMITLMTNVVEGFVTRTMPQLNIMVLGMPLRMLLGSLVIFFALPSTVYLLLPADWRLTTESVPDGVFGRMLENLASALGEFAGQPAPRGE